MKDKAAKISIRPVEGKSLEEHIDQMTFSVRKFVNGKPVVDKSNIDTSFEDNADEFGFDYSQIPKDI